MQCEGCESQVTISSRDEYTLGPVACIGCQRVMKPIKLLDEPINIYKQFSDGNGKIPDEYSPADFWKGKRGKDY